MLNQREWVEGCYAYYAENGYEPGNPEDGDWEKAHYPMPRCLGGVDTVLLLKHHHAVQGVLQSEEHQRCCIGGWEANYLGGEMLRLCKKWQSAGARQAWANRTPEQRRAHTAAARAAQTKRTPEQRRACTAAARAALTKRTPEQRRAHTAAARAANRKPVRITHSDGGVITCNSIAAATFVLQLPRANIYNTLCRADGRLYYKYKNTGILIEYT